MSCTGCPDWWATLVLDRPVIMGPGSFGPKDYGSLSSRMGKNQRQRTFAQRTGSGRQWGWRSLRIKVPKESGVVRQAVCGVL